MVDQFVIVLIVLIIVGKLSWNRGRKRGKEECTVEEYNKGFKAGKESVEKDIRELEKLPDKEILQRIHNFGKKED